MTKVVYNDCYGGFGLSVEAAEMYEKLSGNYLGRFKFGSKIAVSGASDLSRTDPCLIKVVEDLGDRVNTNTSKLAIEEVPSGTRYRIDEYDGLENVMTVDDYVWSIA